MQGEAKVEEKVRFERQTRLRKVSVMLQLFQRNLFNEFAEDFLGRKQELDQKQSEEDKEYEEYWEIERKRGVEKRLDSVLAMVLGTAIRDTDLMRQAYAEVFGNNDRDMRIISGFLALLTGNYTEQIHIRKFAR